MTVIHCYTALRDDGSYVSPYSAIDPADSTDENQEAMEEAGRIPTTIHTATRSL